MVEAHANCDCQFLAGSITIQQVASAESKLAKVNLGVGRQGFFAPLWRTAWQVPEYDHASVMSRVCQASVGQNQHGDRRLDARRAVGTCLPFAVAWLRITRADHALLGPACRSPSPACG